MNLDATTDALTREIKETLEQRFGEALEGVYLFGSRARGEHRPDSDVDVAVVLRRVRGPLAAVDLELLDLTYPLEIERGLHVQAWALPSESMSASGDADYAGLRVRLAATVRREGVRL